MSESDYPEDTISPQRIRILCPLASGFYGTVYKAHYFEPNPADVYNADRGVFEKFGADPKLVAVKKLKPEEFNPTLARRELLAGSINHKHIIKIYGCYTEAINDKKTLCFVLEYCDGGTIAELLANERNGKITISLGAKLCIAYDIARGMYNLHIHKFIHRDLKSENCMIKNRITTNNIEDIDIRKSVVKIIDFGLLRDFKEIVESLKKKIGSKASTLKTGRQSSFLSDNTQISTFTMLPPEVQMDDIVISHAPQQQQQQQHDQPMTGVHQYQHTMQIPRTSIEAQDGRDVFDNDASGVNLTMTVGTFANNPPEMLLGRQDFERLDNNDRTELYNSVIANVERSILSRGPTSFSNSKAVRKMSAGLLQDSANILLSPTNPEQQQLLSTTTNSILTSELSSSSSATVGGLGGVNGLPTPPLSSASASAASSGHRQNKRVMLCSQKANFNLTGKEFIEAVISAIEINKTRMKNSARTVTSVSEGGTRSNSMHDGGDSTFVDDMRSITRGSAPMFDMKRGSGIITFDYNKKGFSAPLSANEIKNIIMDNAKRGINTASMPIGVAQKVLKSTALQPFSPPIITVSSSVLDSTQDDNILSMSPSSESNSPSIENLGNGNNNTDLLQKSINPAIGGENILKTTMTANGLASVVDVTTSNKIRRESFDKMGEPVISVPVNSDSNNNHYDNMKKQQSGIDIIQPPLQQQNDFYNNGGMFCNSVIESANDSTTGTVIHTVMNLQMAKERDAAEDDLTGFASGMSRPYAESTPIYCNFATQGETAARGIEIQKQEHVKLILSKQKDVSVPYTENYDKIEENIGKPTSLISPQFATSNFAVSGYNNNNSNNAENGKYCHLINDIANVDQLFTSSYNVSDYGAGLEGELQNEEEEEREVLNVVKKANLPYNEKIDVFNFGMILINIFNKGLDLDLEEIRDPETFEIKADVIIRELRRNDINDLLIAIILSCFESDPADRPSFRTLKKMFRWLLKENAYLENLRSGSSC